VPGPAVDVIISTLDEEHYVGRCLDAVIAQDYPPELVRIWLIDGGSTDGTVALARRRAADDPRLTVIADGRRRNLPEALNVAIERSSAELVAKIDAHGFPERDFLSRAVAAFDGPDIGCVGGMPIQEGETRFGEALAAARGSRFGVGGGTYAIKGDRRFVDSVQCGVYRRSALERVGGFDPAMNFGEDDELNWRVVQAGYRILLDRRIRFHYIARPTWRSAYRQYRNYGEARVSVVRRHRAFLRPHHLAPALFVGGGATLAAGSLVSPVARRLLAAAVTAYAGAALTAARDAAPAQRLRIAAAFAALHLGYGAGMLRALSRFGSR
jgi:succinoglycan biosynthesis protein ExoA